MPIPFVRKPQPASWPPVEEGPVDGLTLREFHVFCMLSTVPKEVRDVLLDWLIDPTDHYRWQPPSTYSSRRVPFTESELQGKTLDEYRKLAEEELEVIRQTLDCPWQVMGGLKRAGLLVAHGIRLRQLAWVMAPRVAARELQKIIAQRPPDPRFAALFGQPTQGAA